jgi:transposase
LVKKWPETGKIPEHVDPFFRFFLFSSGLGLEMAAAADFFRSMLTPFRCVDPSRLMWVAMLFWSMQIPWKIVSDIVVLQLLKNRPMAGKPINMSTAKQIIALWNQGKKIKQIVKILGISKNTVKNYLKKMELLGAKPCDILNMEDMQVEKMFHSGNPSYKPEKRYENLLEELDYYVSELRKPGVTRLLLYNEYKEKHTNGYSRSQFCFHLQQHLKASNPSMVLEHVPGNELFVDFSGKKCSYVDPDTGEVIVCELFVATLPASDYCFAIAVPSQKVEDFLFALAQCLSFLGGVPKAIVPDNLKSAVTKSCKYEPTINIALQEFANHYGTTIVPTRALKPKDKALVENQVKNVQCRVLAPLRNIIFHSITSLNKALLEQVIKHNQTRMQLKNYCREEQFIAEEKHLLLPLPATVFELKHYASYKVAQNGHVLLGEDKHYYSVPYTLIGTQVQVIYTRSKVIVYSKCEQVAVHYRGYTRGGYTTDRNHLCSAHNHYLDRSPDYYMARAKNVSEPVFEYVRKLFEQNKYPEQLYRQCDGLLKLARTNPADVVFKAFTKALETETYSYGVVKNIIENKTYENQYPSLFEPLPKHSNIRGGKHYQ